MKSKAAAAAILGLGAALLFARRASAGIPSSSANGARLSDPDTGFDFISDPFRSDDIFDIGPDLPTLDLPNPFSNGPDFGGLILNFGGSPITSSGSRFCSTGGVNLIKHFERFEPREYNAGDGLRTIGYGHVIASGERISQPISLSAAESLLARDIAEKCDSAVNGVKASLNQQQTDALYALIFNIGAGAFNRSRCKAAIERGDTASAVQEWQGFKYAGGRVLPGLEKRRLIETQLYVGAYDILVAQDLADEIFA